MEETLTVTAESPTVDVITNQKTFVANREILDAIPTPVRNTPGRALLIPGTTVTPFVLGQFNLTSHGSATSDFTMAIDGLRVNNLCGSGQFSGFYMNDAAVQELSYATGSESAEIQSSGIRVNQVPKDGGNRFSGSFFAQYQGSGLQSDNRTDAMKALQANGLPLVTVAGTAYNYQVNPSFGGPLVKDKLWFYFTYKYEDAKIYVPSARFPDGSQAFRNSMGNYSGRRTGDVGRVEQGQDSGVRRKAVQRRVLQRLQHAGDIDARSHDRCVRRRLDSAGAVDTSAVEQAVVRSRARLLQPAVRAELLAHADEPAGAAEAERLHGPLDRPLRIHDSGILEHDQGLQRPCHCQLRHRVARDEVRPDRPLGRELSHVRAAREHQHAHHRQHGDSRDDHSAARLPVPGVGLQLAGHVVSETSTATSACSARTPGR
jgi:hypothetical protein